MVGGVQLLENNIIQLSDQTLSIFCYIGAFWMEGRMFITKPGGRVVIVSVVLGVGNWISSLIEFSGKLSVMCRKGESKVNKIELTKNIWNPGSECFTHSLHIILEKIIHNPEPIWNIIILYYISQSNLKYYNILQSF